MQQAKILEAILLFFFLITLSIMPFFLFFLKYGTRFAVRWRRQQTRKKAPLRFRKLVFIFDLIVFINFSLLFK